MRLKTQRKQKCSVSRFGKINKFRYLQWVSWYMANTFSNLEEIRMHLWLLYQKIW